MKALLLSITAGFFLAACSTAGTKMERNADTSRQPSSFLCLDRSVNIGHLQGHEDECGSLGCAQNHNGSYSPLVSCADGEASQEKCANRLMLFPNAGNKGCGMLDCIENGDGTFSPQISCSANYVPPACVNSSVKLPNKENKGCGMIGCVQNADGSFSPKVCP